MQIENSKVLVVGMGASGVAVARLLKQKGAIVFITDSGTNEATERTLRDENIAYESGGHTQASIEDAKLVVVSPGVPPDAYPVSYACKHKIPIVSELELACSYANTKNNIIAVTGTNGKTTVTTLIAEILKASLLDTIACGNIGNAVSGEVLKLKPDTNMVIEVSSFQLEFIDKFRPKISVLLNISPDHCDRYGCMEDYLNTKMRICKNQKADDWIVADFENFSSKLKSHKANIAYISTRRQLEHGVWVDDGKMIFDLKNMERFSFRVSDMILKGEHNIQNVLAAATAALLAGASRKGLETVLTSFKGLEHRLEYVTEKNGIKFYNDSKATNVDAANKAIMSFSDPIILIAGGRNKDMDFNFIRDAVRKKVRLMILIGETRKEMSEIFCSDSEIIEASSMKKAVEIAIENSRDGDIVLLSPACASFDMFSSYKERGRVFKQCVMDAI